jgi:hypothetical protein
MVGSTLIQTQPETEETAPYFIYIFLLIYVVLKLCVPNTNTVRFKILQ